MNQTQKNLSDVVFILKEISRFRKICSENFREYFSKNKLDGLYHLNPSDGQGIVICGREAYQRFFRIAKRYLSSQHDHSSKVDLSTYEGAVREEFCQRFLSNFQEVTDKNIARMLSSAYKKVEKKFDSLTHYIPCSIFFDKEPPEFRVGPVHFLHKSKFQKLYGEEIDSQRTRIGEEHSQRCEQAVLDGMRPDQVASKEQSKKFVNRLVDELREFFERFDWVAIVEIKPCSLENSRQRAELVVEGALNVLRLILGESHSDKIRSGFSAMAPASYAKLTRSSDNTLHISSARGYEGNMLGKDWAQIVSENFGIYFSLAAKTLETIVNPSKPMPLCQRFLDALSWYGDAVIENSSAAKVIKYVTAMERITVTGEKEDVSRVVTERSAIFCHDPSEKDFKYWVEKLNKIYTCRSDLLHGSVSPFDESLGRFVAEAGEASRLVLLTGLDFLNSLGLINPDYSVNRLRADFKKLEEDQGQG